MASAINIEAVQGNVGTLPVRKDGIVTHPAQGGRGNGRGSGRGSGAMVSAGRGSGHAAANVVATRQAIKPLLDNLKQSTHVSNTAAKKFDEVGEVTMSAVHKVIEGEIAIAARKGLTLSEQVSAGMKAGRAAGQTAAVIAQTSAVVAAMASLRKHGQEVDHAGAQKMLEGADPDA